MANSAPVANAGTDQNVAEMSTVVLDGSGTDADNDALTFAWTQVSGTAVTIIDADAAQASFEAPAAGGQDVLTFRLTVTDPSGATGSDEVSITVLEPGSAVTVSGVARYEFVPANPDCLGLDYLATELRPIRRATVQLIDASSGAVHGSTTTDDNGNYAITIDPDIDVRVRVRAELKRGGAPSWDVDVRDNTSNTASVLQNRPLYVLDTDPFSSGAVDQPGSVTATTGWNGTSYGPIRGAPCSMPFTAQCSWCCRWTRRLCSRRWMPSGASIMSRQVVLQMTRRLIAVRLVRHFIDPTLTLCFYLELKIKIRKNLTSM